MTSHINRSSASQSNKNINEKGGLKLKKKIETNAFIITKRRNYVYTILESPALGGGT
jgi:hypothetical protein